MFASIRMLAMTVQLAKPASGVHGCGSRAHGVNNGSFMKSFIF